MLKAAHLGPLTIVVISSFFLALFKHSLLNSARIAIAIFAGQLIVGWSNDLIDLPLDKAASRAHKPLVVGSVSAETLKRAIKIDCFATLFLSLFSPFGLVGTVFHVIGILSALLYNFKLKATLLSPLPYIFSFGCLPWAIYLPTGNNPPLSIFLAYIFFATSFHFFNVLKDLDFDLDQNILGLPQRVGKKWSFGLASLLLILGIWQILNFLT